jgi:hypothetical protein
VRGETGRIIGHAYSLDVMAGLVPAIPIGEALRFS